ncbi:MAG: hypothetical protein A2511_17225 [Deltaproteobacteria bacterium RIFOXYD12_FULL_50_9]|nr:MAG: hypothetical protein A2511_17225 [Deltaproteobacteria bacterium RIFOXYD12_FULL_50_9]
MSRVPFTFAGGHALSRISLPWLLLLGLILLGTMAGCGKKTPLVPPLTVLPRPIMDLNYHIDQHGVILSWSRPDLSEGGVRLDKVEEFELLKAEYPVADFCEGCPLTFNKAVAVRSLVPKRFGAKESTVTYRDPDVRPGYRYLYKVRSVAGWQMISKDSNLISFVWQVPLVQAAPVAPVKVKDLTFPATPRDLIKIRVDKGIKLFWSFGTDRDIAGYRIYRRLDKAPNPVLLDSVAANTLSYLDEHLPAGETVWYYMITAIDRQDPPNESPPSAEVRYEVVK